MNTTTATKLFSAEQRTIIDVLRKAEHIVDNKLDKEYDYFNQKRVLPKGMNIAGIDATQGGKNLTHKEYKRYEKKVRSLNTQRLALRQMMANWDSLILPKSVFTELRLKSGLLAIHQSKTGWHKLSSEWSQTNTHLIDSIRNAGVLGIFFENIVGTIMGVFTFLWRGGFIILGVLVPLAASVCVYFSISLGLFLKILLLFISTIIFVMSYFEKKYSDKAKQELESLQTDFSTMFHQLEVLPVSRKELHGENIDMVKISLPKPPQSVLDVMISVYQHLQNKKGFTIMTLADQKAIGLEIKEFVREKPQPIRSAQEEDPAIFVEYGEYVALLPQTFYHLSDLELDFICEVMDVAEQWDARSYVFN